MFGLRLFLKNLLKGLASIGVAVFLDVLVYLFKDVILSAGAVKGPALPTAFHDAPSNMVAA